MTERAPSSSLRSLLRRKHDAVRRALVARHALRAAAACAALLAVAFSIGVAAPGGPGASWTRLALLAAASLAALALGVRAFLAAAPRFDAWLEDTEGRFPELRSWLRNALDLEANADANTSAELADRKSVV